MSEVDGYVILRRRTLSWLLEAYRLLEDEAKPALTKEVVEDLREEVLREVKAPADKVDMTRLAGPIIGIDEHVALLLEDRDLELPRDPAGSGFWKIVVQVVHRMQQNEAEALLSVMKSKET